ncbi:MAG: DUF1343 domain-containing protein [Moraxellaceae bacterium]|nr:MAG: DUF1343 domain-containing protein [Moraxellaceae bacterium]
MLPLFLFLLAINTSACSPNASVKDHKTASAALPEQPETQPATTKKLLTGAEQLDAYLPLLREQRIGLVINHTSLVNGKSLLDTLISRNIKVRKIFVPEHGFRGDADAGATIKNSTDSRSGLPIISLYGNNKKPKAEDIHDIDILVFDMQDVGARFYTYISTLHYVMEAAAEQNKQVIVLDRPNPNGSYIDGPVLEPEHKSFVGMHPIPIVHGLTIGELAQMINGEKWLANGATCKLTVIRNSNYSHDLPYELPVKPSPNLPNAQAIALYPSLCFFEGTNVSLGRGTNWPFQVAGSPFYPDTAFAFTPRSIPGASTDPPHKGKRCYGIDLRTAPAPKELSLQYLIGFYNKTHKAAPFFNNFFTKLAGTKTLQQQIEAGLSEKEIKASWQPGLQKYKTMRKKYLLYPD